MAIDLDTGAEITNNKKSEINKKQKYQVAQSMYIISNVIIHIPEKIEDIMKELNSNSQLSSVEFSILCKSRKEVQVTGETMHVFLTEEFFIPEQEVSAAHIDYLDDNTKFDTVIHKHPAGCRSFSATDKEYINSNFKYSLLFVDGGFNTGNCRFSINNDNSIYITLPTKVAVDYNPKEKILTQDLLDKIKKKVYPQVTVGSPYGYKNGFGYGGGNNYSQYYGGRYKHQYPLEDCFDKGKTKSPFVKADTKLEEQVEEQRRQAMEEHYRYILQDMDLLPDLPDDVVEVDEEEDEEIRTLQNLGFVFEE